MYMTKKKFKRLTALLMALVLTVGAVVPTGAYAYATGLDESPAGDAPAVENSEPVLYNGADRTDLEEAEIATAEDIIVAAGYGFDVEKSFDGISYDEDAVKVSYYADKGNFNGNFTGNYETYYKVEPVSGKKAYLICRIISVREPETVASGSTETGETEISDDDGEPAHEQAVSPYSLSEGRLVDFLWEIP